MGEGFGVEGMMAIWQGEIVADELSMLAMLCTRTEWLCASCHRAWHRQYNPRRATGIDGIRREYAWLVDELKKADENG